MAPKSVDIEALEAALATVKRLKPNMQWAIDKGHLYAPLTDKLWLVALPDSRSPSFGFVTCFPHVIDQAWYHGDPVSLGGDIEKALNEAIAVLTREAQQILKTLE